PSKRSWACRRAAGVATPASDGRITYATGCVISAPASFAPASVTIVSATTPPHTRSFLLNMLQSLHGFERRVDDMTTLRHGRQSAELFITRICTHVIRVPLTLQRARRDGCASCAERFARERTVTGGACAGIRLTAIRNRPVEESAREWMITGKDESERSGGSFALAFAEAPHLCGIAAGLHRTPLARAVLR